MLFIQLFDVIVTDVIVTITNGDLANVIAMFVMADVIAISISIG